MKKKLTVLLIALLSIGAFGAPTARALNLVIDVGDRPFYEGPTYWDSGYEFVWIAGHKEHGHWVHGRYERRGDFHREYAHEHHHHHHHH